MIGKDPRRTGPGRPRKEKIEPELMLALTWGEQQQTLEQLLWGGADVYAQQLKIEEERYEANGQLERALELMRAAEQSTFRTRNLVTDAQMLRDREAALDMCAEAEHRANQRRTSFRLAARSVSMLCRRGASKRAWRENPAVVSKDTAYRIVERMMKVMPAHSFAGDQDFLNAVFVYDQVFRSEGCNTKTGESRGRQRLYAQGEAVNVGRAA